MLGQNPDTATIKAAPPAKANQVMPAQNYQYAPVQSIFDCDENMDHSSTSSAKGTIPDVRRDCFRSRRGANLYTRSEEGKPLKPFGYDLFASAPSTFAPATDIPVPTDYVLGPGDNLRIQLYGNTNTSFTLIVSRDGAIDFPKLGPINVAGQRFDDVRAMLQDKVAKEMIGVQTNITPGELRSIQIFLLGDVNQPGSYTVSALSTITNALLSGGGVSLVGSLRNIQLKRNGQTVRTLDLYDLLLRGDSSRDDRLRPGDVIFVPPVGARVSIDGEVKRPAIYELKGEEKLSEVLALAGGMMASTYTSAVEITRFDQNRKSIMMQIDASKPSDLAMRMQDGDFLRVRKLDGPVENHVRIIGSVRYPGSYEWSSGYDLAQLLHSAQVLPSEAGKETYLPIGLIERTNSESGVRGWMSFNSHDVIAGTATSSLQGNDLVVILSRNDITYLESKAVRDVAAGDFSHVQNCPGLKELASVMNSERSIRFTKALKAESSRYEANENAFKDSVKSTTALSANSDKSSADKDDSIVPSGTERLSFVQDVKCPSVFTDAPKALPYLLDQSVAVYGEVMQPGLYPITQQASLQQVIDAAGGRSNESDPASIEYVSYRDGLNTGHPAYQRLNITQTARLAISPGDIVDFKPFYSGQEAGTVAAAGEFRFPATYGILRGERLSELIQRAGGLTESAYPDGAIFTRLSAAKAEQDSYKRAAKDLQDAMVTAVTSGVLGNNGTVSTQFINSVIDRLQSAPAIGRVVINANPAALSAAPDMDPVLEPGDAIFMPKHPISVTVIGQVLNSGTLQYSPRLTPKQYIQRAGGYSQGADQKRTFVILPNGTAKTMQISFWHSYSDPVPPGTVIVVPRDATPFSLIGWSDRIFGIVSQMAITAAALNTVTK